MKTVSPYVHVHWNNKSGFAYVSQRWESRRVADFFKMTFSVYKMDVASDTEKNLTPAVFQLPTGGDSSIWSSAVEKCIKKN